MQHVALAGAVCTALSVVGYAVGIVEPYPGRAVTVAGVMVGVSLFVTGRALEGQQ